MIGPDGSLRYRAVVFDLDGTLVDFKIVQT
jgi:beta-phosphoglucomutase-like phosphatase (HAD superfamily)